MKNHRAMWVVLAILCLSAVASAGSVADMRIVFDPGVTPGTFENLYIIANQGTAYNVNWLDCSAYPNPPFNPPPSSNGFDACLGFFNSTGANLSEFDLSFTVPATGPGSILIGQPLTCDSVPPNLTDNTCPSGNLTAGENVDVAFFGGNPILPNQAFFVGEVGVACDASSGTLPCTNLPPFTVTDPAPEPSSLLLLAAGITALGMGWAYRRRRLA